MGRRFFAPAAMLSRAQSRCPRPCGTHRRSRPQRERRRRPSPPPSDCRYSPNWAWCCQERHEHPKTEQTSRSPYRPRPALPLLWRQPHPRPPASRTAPCSPSLPDRRIALWRRRRPPAGPARPEAGSTEIYDDTRLGGQPTGDVDEPDVPHIGIEFAFRDSSHSASVPVNPLFWAIS